MNPIQAELAQAVWGLPQSSGPVITVLNPATQEIVGTVPVFSASEISMAVERAHAAQKKWASVSISGRLQVLRRFQQLLCEQKDAVAGVITGEAGKPLAEATSTEILVVLDAAQYLLNHAAEFLRHEP